jgi:hypothetical protein
MILSLIGATPTKNGGALQQIAPAHEIVKTYLGLEGVLG